MVIHVHHRAIPFDFLTFYGAFFFFFFDTKSQAPQPILIPSRHLTDAFDHASMVEDI